MQIFIAFYYRFFTLNKFNVKINKPQKEQKKCLKKGISKVKKVKIFVGLYFFENRIYQLKRFNLAIKNVILKIVMEIIYSPFFRWY